MYVRTIGRKRLTIELPLDQYEFLRRKASSEGTTVSGLIRDLIEERRSHPAVNASKNRKGDSFYGDAHHAEAIRFRNSCLNKGELLMTSDYVLDESYTIIRFKATQAIAVEFGENGPQFLRDHHRVSDPRDS
jgi:hypothetical protein